MMEHETPWYKALVSVCNELGEELGLDDDGTKRMRDFVILEAKRQYTAGNRAGIYWARNMGNDGKAGA